MYRYLKSNITGKCYQVSVFSEEYDRFSQMDSFKEITREECMKYYRDHSMMDYWHIDDNDLLTDLHNEQREQNG